MDTNFTVDNNNNNNNNNNNSNNDNIQLYNIQHITYYNKEYEPGIKKNTYNKFEYNRHIQVMSGGVNHKSSVLKSGIIRDR